MWAFYMCKMSAYFTKMFLFRIPLDVREYIIMPTCWVHGGNSGGCGDGRGCHGVAFLTSHCSWVGMVLTGFVFHCYLHFVPFLHRGWSRSHPRRKITPAPRPSSLRRHQGRRVVFVGRASVVERHLSGEGVCCRLYVVCPGGLLLGGLLLRERHGRPRSCRGEGGQRGGGGRGGCGGNVREGRGVLVGHQLGDGVSSVRAGHGGVGSHWTIPPKKVLVAFKVPGKQVLMEQQALEDGLVVGDVHWRRSGDGVHLALCVHCWGVSVWVQGPPADAAALLRT